MALRIDTTSWPSPNYDRREDDTPVLVTPVGIMLHSCEGVLPRPRVSSLPWLCNPRSGASSNYYVDRDGQVYQIVVPGHRAWHAGTGRWRGITDGNSAFIGIELEHRRGMGGYPDAQMNALSALCRKLIADHEIRQEMVIAHRWWAPNRKADPTDWPDVVLRAWIAALYAPATPHPPLPPGPRYRIVAPKAIVRAGPSTMAQDTRHRLAAGTVVTGEVVEGAVHASSPLWLKLADGSGFVWLGLMVPSEGL